MDRNFARSLQLVLRHEGGWADNPKDPGGATMKGITIATFRRFVDAKATKDDLRHITDAQIADIYRRQYWRAVKGDDLPDGVDYATFDFAVNSGPDRAAKYLQASVGAAQDGKIGPETIAALKWQPAAKTVNAICDARLVFMRKIKGKDGKPLWETFGKGWNSRVAECRKEALIMCAASHLAPQEPVQRGETEVVPVEATIPVVPPVALPVPPLPEPLNTGATAAPAPTTAGFWASLLALLMRAMGWGK